jgi:hypothetical protein
VPDPDLTAGPAAVGEPVDGLPATEQPETNRSEGRACQGAPNPNIPSECALPLGGATGQLVDRLVWVLDHDDPSLVTRWWAEVGMIVAVSIGGSAVEVMPSAGAGTTIGIDLTSGSGVLRVGRSSYLNALRFRLLELVDDGIDERFLVRALRDEIAEFLATDYVGSAPRVEDLAALVERLLAEASLRGRLREQNPYFHRRSDNELVGELTGACDSLDGPDPGALEALVQWAAQDAWSRWTAEALDDEHLDQWTSAGRLVRGPGPRLRVIRADDAVDDPSAP